MKSTSGFALLAFLALASFGCGGGKRRAEHARGGGAPSAIDTPAASAAPAPAKQCQISGFAYAVPAPAAIVAASGAAQ